MAVADLPRIALSIRQPWAWLIVNGYKLIENRDWATKRRGPVLIHASKQIDAAGYNWVLESGLVPSDTLPTEFQCGGIVGVATIADCVTESDSPWFFGKYGFVLTDAKPLPFQPLRGALGFFKVMK